MQVNQHNQAEKKHLTYQAEKKRAIVQQTIGITDNVAVHQCVHTL